MTLTLPPEFPDWLVTMAAGHFPQCDEDALNRNGDGWSAMGNTCKTVSQRSETAGGATERSGTGEMIGQLIAQQAQIAKHWLDMGEYCDQMAEQCFEAANIAEFDKLTVIATGLVLLIQLAVDAWMFHLGAVKAASDRAVAEMTMRKASAETIAQLASRGARATALRRSLFVMVQALGIAQGGLVNYGVQKYRIAEGKQQSIDEKQLATTAFGGVVAYGVGSLVGMKLAPRVGRLAANLDRKVTSSVARYAANALSTTLLGGAGGAAGSIAATIATAAVTGGKVTWSDIGTSAVAGVGGGFIGAAGHAVHAHTPPGEPPKVPIHDDTGGPDANSPGGGGPKLPPPRSSSSGDPLAGLNDSLPVDPSVHPFEHSDMTMTSDGPVITQYLLANVPHNDTRYVAVARDKVHEMLLTWPNRDDATRARLLTSETVTNAIQHGEGDTRVVSAQRWTRDGRPVLRVEVSDRSSVLPVDPIGDRWRGRGLTELLADRHGVLRHENGGKTLWFEVDQSPPLPNTIGDDVPPVVTEYLGEPRVRQALDAANMTHDAVTINGVELPVGDAVGLAMSQHPKLASMLDTYRDIEEPLLERPLTLLSLMRHPKSIDMLYAAIREVSRYGPDEVFAYPHPEAVPVELTSEQRVTWDGVQEHISTLERNDPDSKSQPGFLGENIGNERYLADYIEHLRSYWERDQAALNSIVRDVVNDGGGHTKSRTEPKGFQRCWDKMVGKHGGDPSQIADIAAAKIHFDSVDQVYAALKKFHENDRASIVDFDDRFLNPKKSGYRDLRLTLRLETGRLAEVQLMLNDMAAVDVLTHPIHEFRGALIAQAKFRKLPLSPEFRALIASLERRESELFTTAFDNGYAAAA